MSDLVRHWRRPLKSGGCEFFMRAKGQTMSGSAASYATASDLRELFERDVGCRMPAPEIKPRRGWAAA